MLKVRKDTYKYNIIYLSKDGIDLVDVIKELYRDKQYLSVLYLKDNDINTSIDIYWDEGIFYAKSNFGHYMSKNIEGICKNIEKIYKNMVIA